MPGIGRGVPRPYRDLKKELAAAADPERARNSAWFFKTGKGHYGHGDRFIGLTVPTIRRIAHRYVHLPLTDVETLLASPIHEYRCAALEILVASAPYIFGQHLLTRPRRILYRLAKSKSLWERRIAIVSTMMFIRAD